MDENNFYEKEELLEQLDRHLDSIKSCDTKASIVLGVIGIFLTIFASDSSIKMLNLVFSEVFQNFNFSNLLYLLLFALYLYFFIYGAYSLIRVLVPRLSKEAQTYHGIHKDSLYFFENIAQNSFFEFKEKLASRTEEDKVNDILSQIFINAKICTVKYSLYNRGIKFSFLGIAGILILYVIGIILSKLGGFS
jgi:ABC-type protease/lipase transport system fused ATPase/permease subunit